MAAIPGFRFDITGASGSQGLLSPRNGWQAYVFPRGGNAAQDSTGTLITFDSSAIASRFAVNNWIQVGTATSKIVKVTAVGGNSISVNSAVTVTENDRIFLIGNTQPSVSGGSATYITPNTLIRQRGDDAADLYANSKITTNSDGLVQGYASPAMYDVLVQDGNQSNQGYIVDLEIGTVEGVSVTDTAYFGSTVVFSGNQTGISSSGWAVFGSTVTMHSTLGVTGTVVAGSTLTVQGKATIQTLFLRGATDGGNGVVDPTLFSYVSRAIGSTLISAAVKTVDIKTQFTGTTSATNLSLNGMHVINQYGVGGSGGGDVQTGLAVGAYSEHRGNTGVTGALYGAENATSMYNTGSVVTAFGSLNTAQIASGSSSVITTAIGVRGLARIDGGTGTIATAIGVDGLAGLQDAAFGVVTDAIGGRFTSVKDAGCTGTITNAYGIHILTVNDGGTNNFGLRIQGATGGSNINQSLRVDSGEASFLGSVSFAGVSNSNLTQATSLNLPDGCFFGVSGTLGAGTSISQMTLMTGREIVLWAAAGTMGFSRSNNVLIVGTSFNIPQGSAVKCFCTGQTWFIFSP